ncbi:2-C-methyl-D-erythritol 4-phosphate cytidylyltransferase [Porphyromonas macacae]|uniref:2-C-methyl-D-erythritol 4-phosphate cytidylyltransferase n=1 Tax=Porphyromonas macacae TaxID=28115 RepID=A0A379DHQ1_9PORP|nr:2-C-methyl-D-erythritol 4-phosphate cytidylyltransferase [Porphyromonas macacae]SUB77861.1 2-C-methyl-D-erythritol 4-phosphate cytidylyltransferase 2 [Porphyromonas macacae]
MNSNDSSKPLRYAIVVAGGRGSRMGSDIPKQFLLLGKEPVLMHTLRKWYALCEKCVLVLPKDQQQVWKELCAEYRFDVPHRIADGGETRFHSVRSGLLALEVDSGLVAIHDGVRPLVSTETIERCFEAAEADGAAVPVMPLIESLRKLNKDGSSRAVPRSEYVMVQTPQTFDLALIRRAYEQPYRTEFTDDASVYEAAYPGRYPATVAGNQENIKLTDPVDMEIARLLLERR